MPKAQASWLLLIGRAIAQNVRARSILCCLRETAQEPARFFKQIVLHPQLSDQLVEFLQRLSWRISVRLGSFLSILPSFTTFWTVTCSPDALTEGARDVILCLHPRGCAIQFPIEGTAMFAHASII